MYYQIEKDGQPIEYIEFPLFVRWDKRAKILIGCNEKLAEGIVSKDRKTIYHIEGIESEGRFTGGEVTYKEITEKEYEDGKSLETLSSNEYGIKNDLLEQIQADYRKQLAQEVANNVYNT